MRLTKGKQHELWARTFYDYLKEYSDAVDFLGCPQDRDILESVIADVVRDAEMRLDVDVRIPIPEPETDWSQYD